METSDKHKFFRTEASHAEDARKEAKAGNKHGNPIVMKSKILAAIIDPASPQDSIFIAESAATVRRVNISSGEIKKTYRGPTTPVTCVALGGPRNATVFAGSWDKDIWSWDVESGKPGIKFTGHSDFVKAVVCVEVLGRHLLVSGGADKKIMVWDAESGARLHTLQDPDNGMMAVQALAVDPYDVQKDFAIVASASSDPHIRRWIIAPDRARQVGESWLDWPDAVRPTLHLHRTSVYSLYFAFQTDDGEGDNDLFSSDADGLAKCSVRYRGFVAEDVYEHGDYLRAVVATESWVVTAGRDEDVKIWDRASAKLYCTLAGHYDEVTGLVLLRDARGRPDRVCSVSIDGTIRTWPLVRTDLDAVVKEMEDAKEAAAAGEVTVGGADDNKPENIMTAEEEAELAELMADDDDEA